MGDSQTGVTGMHRLCARRDVLPYARYGSVSSVKGHARHLKPSAYYTYLLTLTTAVARWGRRPVRAHPPGRLEQDRPKLVPHSRSRCLRFAPLSRLGSGFAPAHEEPTSLKSDPPSRLVSIAVSLASVVPTSTCCLKPTSLAG